MRTIKFRVWDIAAKQFQECYDIDVNGKFAHVAIADQCYMINEDGKEPEFILSQFTGLLDKNGREIYEGDILQCVVNNTVSKFDVKYSDDVYNFGFHSGDLKVEGWQYSEVIGNIFETPMVSS